MNCLSFLPSKNFSCTKWKQMHISSDISKDKHRFKYPKNIKGPIWFSCIYVHAPDELSSSRVVWTFSPSSFQNHKDLEQQRLSLLLETSVKCSMSWMGPRETKYRQVMMSWPYKQGKLQITGAHQLAMYLLGHPIHLPDTMKLFLMAYFCGFFVPRLNFLSDAMPQGRGCVV